MCSFFPSPFFYKVYVCMYYDLSVCLLSLKQFGRPSVCPSVRCCLPGWLAGALIFISLFDAVCLKLSEATKSAAQNAKEAAAATATAGDLSCLEIKYRKNSIERKVKKNFLRTQKANKFTKVNWNWHGKVEQSI